MSGQHNIQETKNNSKLVSSQINQQKTKNVPSSIQTVTKEERRIVNSRPNRKIINCNLQLDTNQENSKASIASLERLLSQPSPSD